MGIYVHHFLSTLVCFERKGRKMGGWGAAGRRAGGSFAHLYFATCVNIASIFRGALL